MRPDFNPGNARWCETHGRMECTKQRRRQAGLCHKQAIRGTNSCTNHAGISTAHAMAVGEAKIDAWNAIGAGARTIDPSMAVLGVLQMSWLRLHAYARLLKGQAALERQEAEDRYAIEAAESGALSGTIEGGPRYGGAGGFGEEIEVQPGTEGIIGYSIGSAGKEGTLFRQSEQIRALVVLEGQERDRVVKYAKTAHDMGISTRMTELAEAWGDRVASRVTLMFDDLDLTPAQKALIPVVVERHLSSLDMSDEAA